MPYKKQWDKWRLLDECLLLSSFKGKGSRTRVELRGLPSGSTCVLEAEPGKLDIRKPSDSTCILEALPGKLDIKRREPGSLQVGSLFKLAITTYTVVIDFRV